MTKSRCSLTRNVLLCLPVLCFNSDLSTSSQKPITQVKS